MKRRAFITLLGGAVAAPTILRPRAARAQQPAMPVIGFLTGNLAATFGDMPVFRQGLKEAGYVEGQNVAIEYRFAEGHYDRLPALAIDLVARRVTVIFAPDNTAAQVAKPASTAIPVVFSIGGDPVKLGLVASLNRPGGNITGVSFLATALMAKKLELLHQVAPDTATIGLLVNPANSNAEPNTREAQEAAHALGLQLHVLSASNEREIDAAFAMLVQRHAGALVVDGDPFFTGLNSQIVALAARHAMPAIYGNPDYVAAGGLMSYGGPADARRLAGVYVGRILKGEKPADLPVQQSTKVELTINLKTAKALGLTVPLALLTRADEVIE
jgi:putative ABC transport system substrate-binding protein